MLLQPLNNVWLHHVGNLKISDLYKYTKQNDMTRVIKVKGIKNKEVIIITIIKTIIITKTVKITTITMT